MKEYFLALVYIKKLCLTTFCNDVQQITFGLTLFVFQIVQRKMRENCFFLLRYDKMYLIMQTVT